MNYNNYYENFDIANVKIIKGQKKSFSFASPSSIHSEVTDWAYGKVLSRTCVDISDGKELKGSFDVSNANENFYLKITACLTDWQKYVNSLKVVINGKIVVDEKEAFFENVNLGWPSLYFPLPKKLLSKGKNEISFQTENKNGAGLYFSEAKIIGLKKPKNLSQISGLKAVKENKVFGIAILNESKAKISKCETDNCIFLKSKAFDNITVLSFRSGAKGSTSCTVSISGRQIKLDMPKVYKNGDNFLVGQDSDDHRHDESEEFTRIPYIFAMSSMGNFLQFRPQQTRNYYKLASKESFKKVIEFLSMFGIKYGLCDSGKKLNYLPEVDKKNFLGYHVHEPYLYFNIVSDYSGFFEGSVGNKEMVLSSNSFGESKELYIKYLKGILKNLPKNNGQTSVGAPSMLCAYEGEAGFDRITIEPVSNINLLMGTVRATSVKRWGAHLPPDWYFGVPVDKVKSNKARLALQYLYLNGASYVYYENATFKTNAFERCDWESSHCVYNRQNLRDFYDYSVKNPREGKLVVDKALLYGNNEFLMWQTNDRMAELKEKDWDNTVWGKWDNAYQHAWQASEAWLPYSKKQSKIKSPLNKYLFAGTPYGNIDVVSIEKNIDKYKTIALLGWNTMTDDLIEKLKSYVKKGGNLVIGYCHFNYTDRNDKKAVYPSSDKIKDLLGGIFESKVKISDKLSFKDGKTITAKDNAYVAKGKNVTAEVLCKDKNGNGIVYKNKYGKGTVYFNAFYDYYSYKWAIETVKHTLTLIGDNGDVKCDNPEVSFTVRLLKDGKYKIDVLNMNCIDSDIQEFNIKFKGKKIKGKVKVGEIKSYKI